MKQQKLEEYFEKRQIKGIVFDIDNTLLATGEYYRDRLRTLSIQLAPKLDSSKEPEEVARAISDSIFLAYEKDNRRPRLIIGLYINGLKEYLNDSVPRKIESFVEESLSDFYLTSPTPFEYAPKVLKSVLDSGIGVVLHSHAQEDWTKIKVTLLESGLGYSLPYLATDIDEYKDKDSWLKAFDIIKIKPQNSLVVGDNFESDILASIEAGCKNLRWIDKVNEGITETESIPEDVQLITINDVKEVLDIPTQA